MSSQTFVDPFPTSSRRQSYGRAISSPVIGKSSDSIVNPTDIPRRSNARVLSTTEDGASAWHSVDATSLVNIDSSHLPSNGRFDSWIGNPMFADMKFLVGSEKTVIPAHRVLLTSTDSIFAELLQAENSDALISALASSLSSVFSFNEHSSRSTGSASTLKPHPSRTSQDGPSPTHKHALVASLSLPVEGSTSSPTSAPESPSTNGKDRHLLDDGVLPIVLEDVKPEIFLKLISFLYSNKVTLYFDIVADYNVILDLLDLSDRFRVPSLSRLLINFLETDTNALKIIGPELISQLKTKIMPVAQGASSQPASRKSSVSSATSSTMSTSSSFTSKQRGGVESNSGGTQNMRLLRPRSGTNQSDESDSVSDRMGDAEDSFDESSDSIQYNIISRSIQFSDTIKRRIAVAKLRIEEQARKMKADAEEIDWICSKPDLLPPRVHHTASSFGNALVLIGGHDGNQNPVSSGVEFLIEPSDKPGSLVWTETRKTGTGPRALHSHATCRVGNKFYIYGGVVDGEKSSKLWIVAVINDDTVHWSTPRLTGDLPPPLINHTLLRFDKLLVLFGGLDTKDHANGDVWTMDTETNKWTKRLVVHCSASPLTSSSSTGQVSSSQTSSPSSAHIGSSSSTGQMASSSSSGQMTSSSSNTSHPQSSSKSHNAGSYPLPRYGHCALIIGSKMLVIGGQDHHGNYFNDAISFDLETNVWMNFSNKKSTVPRMAFHGAARVGRHILVYGGRRKSSGLIKELWKLIWDENSGEVLWTKLKCSSPPHERFGHTLNRIGSKIYVVGGCNEKGKPFGDLSEANTVHLPFENDARLIDHSELEISSLVGMGNFSQVRRGIWNNNLIAIKLIKGFSRTEHRDANSGQRPPRQDKQKFMKDFKSEVELLSQLKHPNLVTFLGYCLEPNAIVMEYLPQNLHDYLIENRGKCESQQMIDFAYDIARGMEYLHRNSIIHRDLKSFNILLDENLNVKIADFGIARVKTNTSTMTTTGTIAWTAPEILRHEAYNEKSDVYSYAIVLWEIVTEGDIPFEDEFQSPMEAGIAVATGQIRPSLPSHTDSNWVSLLEKCWKEDPASRPSFAEIMELIKKFE
jgi:hypothetical protein